MRDTAWAVELWGRYGAAYDAAFTEANYRFAEVALERSGLTPGMSVLDIAAGAGALAIPAARRGAEVLATDLSPTMLELLERRAQREGLDGIRTRVMSGTALDVGADRFDRVCSEFGVMFFLDAGLPEMRRVLAPGGRAVVVTWGHPDNVPLSVYRVALERVLGPGGGPAEVPVVLDPGLLGPAMEAAGFEHVEVFAHTEPYPVDSLEQIWHWMRDVSPGYASILAQLDPETQARVRDVVLDETVARYGDDFRTLPMESVIAIGS